ncbi:hypothetical protein TomTYG75_07550 [Sphingobium sp. TomTYG75]
MRVLNPFSFWPNYASAIRGFGGSDNGPDPSYCFHTLYQEFAPGSVVFHVRLVNARATCGEIELRINGYRPNSGMDAILVAGARISLEDVAGDIEIPLRVAVLPGVSYAIFCRYTEPSDLNVEGIKIEVEEFEDDDADTYASEDLEHTRFGNRNTVSASSIIVADEPEIDFPCSQPFTKGQLRKGRFWSEAPAAIAALTDPVDKWRHAIAYKALQSYGFLAHGACGAISQDFERLTDVVAAHGVLASVQDGAMVKGPFDFMIATLPSRMDTESVTLPNAILNAIRPVRRNGMIAVFFDYDVSSSGFEDIAEQAGRLPGRHMLQQAALKIIGHGCDVAQLRVPLGGSGMLAANSTARPFAMLISR